MDSKLQCPFLYSLLMSFQMGKVYFNPTDRALQTSVKTTKPKGRICTVLLPSSL